jgi:preprotein translocase subunit SecG
MAIFLTIVHVLVCLFLGVVVLLQSGKAADLAGAFGGMGSQTVFGPRGSTTMLSKATTIAAAIFMLTSFGLSVLATKGTKGSNLLEKATKPAAVQQQKSTTPQPGQTVPINVTPIQGGKPGQTQTIPVPVVPAPPGAATTPAQQQQKKK